MNELFLQLFEVLKSSSLESLNPPLLQDIKKALDSGHEFTVTENAVNDTAPNSATESSDIETVKPTDENAASDKLNEKLDAILNSLKNIKLEDMQVVLNNVQASLTKEDYKDGLVRQLHQELEQYRNNFYNDIKRPFIKSIIAIHNQMNKRLLHSEEVPDDNTDYKKLYEKTVGNIKFDKQAIEDILDDEYDLNYYEPNVGEMYNAKEENAIKVEITNNKAQSSMIKDVIYGGFKSTQDGKVFLKANVIVYRFEDNTNK
jgi:hypothetical protein